MRATKIRKGYLFRNPVRRFHPISFSSRSWNVTHIFPHWTIASLQRLSFRSQKWDDATRDKSRRNPSSLCLVEIWDSRSGRRETEKAKARVIAMNPEVSPRGRIPDRIVTLAWPRSHGSISRQMVGHEREISRVGGALEENCKKRFYSRLFDSDTKDFEVLETTNGRNRCRVDEIRRRLAIYRCEQRWYSSSIPQQFLPRHEARRGRARGPPVQHFRNSTPSFHVT